MLPPMLFAAMVGSMLTLGIPECRDLDRESRGASEPTERVGTLQNTAWLALRAYQVAISPADGAGCTMYPSCSRYAMRAVRSDGPFRAVFMATGRILRAHRNDAYPLCRANGRLFHYNPPEDDAWWRSSR